DWTSLQRRSGAPRSGGRFHRCQGTRTQYIQDCARSPRNGARAAPCGRDGGLIMSIAAPEPKANMGNPVPRYDALAKVTGKANYAADVPLNRPAYAFLVTSAVARGRIDSFDLSEARKVRGLIDIVTHENAESLNDAGLFSNGGYASTTIQPLKSADIAHDGQIIAVVLAETFEAARQAAFAVNVNYAPATASATLSSPGTTSAR